MDPYIDLSGTIALIGDPHYYQFAGDGGDRMNIRLRTLGTLTAYLHLREYGSAFCNGRTLKSARTTNFDDRESYRNDDTGALPCRLPLPT